MDLFGDISQVYVTQEAIVEAVEGAPQNLEQFWKSIDIENEEFEQLLQLAYKPQLAQSGRTELSTREIELMKKFAKNNSSVFTTLRLNFFNDTDFASIFDEDTIERLVRYPDIQDRLLNMSRILPGGYTNDQNKILTARKDGRVLTTFKFVFDNLKQDNKYIDPLIERLCESMSLIKQQTERRDNEEFFEIPWGDDIVFPKSYFGLVEERLRNDSQEISEYEKTIISYLALNPAEAYRIRKYEDILHFVENKNIELDNIMGNPESTFVDIKDAYLQRAFRIRL